MSETTLSEMTINLDELDLSEPDPYSFMGTDGEYYAIGPTPRIFEEEVMEFMQKHGHLGSRFPNMPEFLAMWDRWIWLHVSSAPGQHHFSVEVVKALYFTQDRPHIINCILRRFMDSLHGSNLMIDSITDLMKEGRLDLARRNEKAESDGNTEP